MTNKTEPPCGEATSLEVGRSKSRLVTFGSIAGIGGTLVCSLSMVAASVGLFAAGGVAATQGGMAGMGSTDDGGTGAGATDIPGWLDIVLRFGPGILLVSVLLITASVALRRRTAALPAIGGGLVLYVGMYAQPNLVLMYATIVVGTVLLVLAYAASLRPARRENR